MGTPQFITELREHIGHTELWLPGVTAIVVKDVAPDAPAFATPEVLLVRRSDDGRWTPVCGIVDPGEEPHAAAVREVREETGLTVEVDALIGVGAVGPVTFPNGDVCDFLDIVFRCRHVSGEPRVNDDESLAVGWFPLDGLPDIRPRDRESIERALAPHDAVHYEP